MNILALCVYVCKDVHLNSSVICFYISASLQVVKTVLVMEMQELTGILVLAAVSRDMVISLR